MRFTEDKKKAIQRYILEKVEQKATSVSKSVAENFEVNPSTVHAYLNELTDKGIIRKIKRDEYELVVDEYTYNLKRSSGDLDSDTYAYEACLREHIKGYDANVQRIWNYCFSEMINNVMDHSMAENVEIVVRQNFLSTAVWICDNGIGIFEKIRSYFDFESIDVAICELFKGKLTTDAKNHSGEGIFFSSRLMDDFVIVSSGRVFSNNRYDESKIENCSLECTAGTLVYMELSNYSRKTAKDVFDMYASVDGGFVKTSIPLKNVFDDAPISRSQAKRICNSLEKFSEVILDFTGISWMGQGFAHQVFVVFQGNHPKIKLTPICMNEDVTRMYNHVMTDVRQ